MKIPTNIHSAIPINSHEEAIRGLESWKAQEPDEVDAQSGMRWLTHGEKAKRVIVFLHGYTNCPRQFYQLGDAFFQHGYNVLIPRFPGHAMRDRMTTALANIKAKDLITTTNRAINIAQGLGEEIWVMGLSMGGVLTTWIAYNRPEVSGVVIISPAIGVQALPAAYTHLLARVVMHLPNVFVWWDSKTKDTPLPPLHAYPRYATRSLAQVLNLGQSLLAQARKTPPKTPSVVIVINPTDEAVDIDAVRKLAQYWQSAGCQNLRQYTFDPKYHLKHDLIDPDQPDQKIDIVYPVLLDLVPAD